MTIKELVNSLNVGDKISYIKPKSRGRFDQRTGIIVQILEKFITVDLGKYRDSLEICDIANGHISILDAENNPIVIEKEEPAKPPAGWRKGGSDMKKATGIVRAIDPLGRVVIPMELRRTMDIQEGDPLEIFTTENEIVIKKYNPGCTICGAVEGNIVAYKGKLLCSDCIESAGKMLGR